MSASVDQRTKGQPNTVQNGTVKETVQDEEFDKYIQHQQAGYNAAPMSSPGVSDPFVNYYNPSMSFPYLGQGLGEGAWSNGGDATVFSMGNYDYNGMFGGFGYPQFAWDYPASEYWNNATQGRSDKREYEDYYRMIPADGYGTMNGEVDRTAGISSVEQGFKGMSLVGEKVDGSVSDGIPGDSAGVPINAGVHGHGHAPQKASWAAIASQPARPQTQMRPRPPRAPMNPNKQNLDIGTWDNKNNANRQGSQQGRTWSAPRRTMTYNSGPQGNSNNSSSSSPPGTSANSGGNASNHPVLEKLKSTNQYNPKEYNLNPKGARFFIIKSYSEDDIHRSIKYSIWCSTEHGNKRLDGAFRERESKGPIYLLFSVNGSGHFCGMAQMMSKVDYGKSSGVWAQDKWKGQIEVKWVYVKDVPNSQLRHIRLENNENKPVTNSRDTQEVPPEKGKQVLKIIHNYRHTTSIFDDFVHYEKRQQEEPVPPENGKPERSSSSGSGSSNGGSKK